MCIVREGGREVSVIQEGGGEGKGKEKWEWGGGQGEGKMGEGGRGGVESSVMRWWRVRKGKATASCGGYL